VIAAILGAGAAPVSAGYEPLRGEEFFLLSDASVGSDGVAVVRLEVPAAWDVARYGGVDVVVYRVPEPLDFLKAQPNLHRVQVKPVHVGEGAGNTLRYLWTSWNRRARASWQLLFTAEARQAVTARAPELRSPAGGWRVAFQHPPQFVPLPGFELVDRFRYPVMDARPIEPPKDVALAGSSSHFIHPVRGNVLVPIGRQKPGLYLVEGYLGSYRAVTLVFVSDTLALTKISSGELMLWTVSRQTGRAVSGVEVAWTDGVGTLASGRTGSDGTVVLRHQSPERTYVIGRDEAGGVFVSENFYYDSEIYTTKLYGFTDRPLYRPGDTVRVKVLGREFKDGRRSVPLAAGDVGIIALDPTGTPVATKSVPLSGESGTDTAFVLPANALSGGYDLRLVYRGDTYGAAFRVAEYVKPHFEITLALDRPEFRTGEPVTGRIVLAYPGGEPVKRGVAQLVVKAQPLTMVEGELRYGDRMPVSLETEQLAADDKGTAAFRLPPAAQPSRYILTVLANDGAAHRVKATREILIERGATLYTLTAPRRFSYPGEAVTFSLSAQGAGAAPPARWEILRLENRAQRSGTLERPDRWAVTFSEPGSYTLSVRDAAGNLLAATNHWVAGPGLTAAPGNIEIVFDRDQYRAGETAKALITFAEPVEEALLTLERDRVEQWALLSRGGPWLRLARLGPSQWRAEIPVRAELAPNVTLSVLYARGGDYVFENRGLRVERESVTVQFETDRATYRPGDEVTVRVTTTIGGRPTPARVTVSVVDEMVYVLQPEIAPDVLEFFYHPRRNNVRTTSSLAFIAYDMALSSLPAPPGRSGASSRGVKVLERPRRDIVDTAAWIPDLRTDGAGRATFTFRMPDALTRWRITGRAMTASGVVGQRSAWITSFKPVYLKWASPARFRAGDAPVIDLVVFNETPDVSAVDLTATGAGVDLRRPLRLSPGATHVALPVAGARGGAVALELRQGGVVLDTSVTTVQVTAVGWVEPRSVAVAVTGTTTPLALPPDARNVRVSVVTGAVGHFAQIADDLVEYPWGCVEQTASRVIPLSLAQPLLGGAPFRIRDHVSVLLQTHRLRLVQMASPDATFAWWGPGTAQSALMTAYAYYADWHASRALGIALPPDHWARALEAYRKHSAVEPLLHRALAVWFMGEMGLPVKTLLEGLQAEVAGVGASGSSAGLGRRLPDQQAPWPRHATSPLLADPTSPLGHDLAVVLLAQIAAQQREVPAPAVGAHLDAARRALHASGLPVARALLLLGDPSRAIREAGPLLSEVRREMPTFDRALTLVWVHGALGGAAASPAVEIDLRGDWQPEVSWMGNRVWRFTGRDARPAALELAAAPSRPITAIVRYDSAAPASGRLPVTVERRLYRLEPTGKPLEFAAEAIAGTVVSSTDLYVDEITVTPRAGERLRYAILEVSLPPGADVERTTWGIRVGVPGAVEPRAVDRARHEPGDLSYAIPIDGLDGALTVRHLVRFSQRGRFELPPARVYRMYQPEEKAQEDGGPRILEIN
jgi:uncharacterized protein YfaS (alpha-2-macroglobulin family)